MYWMESGGLVHVMTPSNYAKAVHTAMREYNQGNYAVSYELWNDIISIGGASYFATNNMAQCLFQEKQYDEAAALYRASGDREGYSKPSGISATNGSARRCRICCLGWRPRRPR